jgi:hypothetical protein
VEFCACIKIASFSSSYNLLPVETYQELRPAQDGEINLKAANLENNMEKTHIRLMQTQYSRLLGNTHIETQLCISVLLRIHIDSGTAN